MKRGKKLCLTCLKDFEMEVRMHEAEALIHVDAYPHHKVVEEKDVKEKGTV